MPLCLTLRKKPTLFSGGRDWHKRVMTGLIATILSVAVLAAFALLAGGAYLLIKRKDGKQGVLMLVAAAVLFANVLIWTV